MSKYCLKIVACWIDYKSIYMGYTSKWKKWKMLMTTHLFSSNNTLFDKSYIQWKIIPKKIF